MANGIKYYYKEEELKISGNPCPICGKYSWKIYQCNQCGKVFCIKCRPDLVKFDDELECTDVTCECGNGTLFVSLD